MSHFTIRWCSPLGLGHRGDSFLSVLDTLRGAGHFSKAAGEHVAAMVADATRVCVHIETQVSDGRVPMVWWGNEVDGQAEIRETFTMFENPVDFQTFGVFIPWWIGSGKPTGNRCRIEGDDFRYPDGV